jgi:hypothetical protein
MNKKILCFAALVLFSLSAFADQFCNGFQRGYVTGFMQASGSSLEPLVPMCPMQPMKKMNDPQSDFEHGYLIGLQRGLASGRK